MITEKQLEMVVTSATNMDKMNWWLTCAEAQHPDVLFSNGTAGFPGAREMSKVFKNKKMWEFAKRKTAEMDAFYNQYKEELISIIEGQIEENRAFLATVIKEETE